MGIQVDSVLEQLCGLLLPPRCVLCGASGQRPCLDLCAACAGDLPTALHPVADGSPPVELWFAPYRYGYPLDRLVQRLKYQGQLAAGRVLGTLLAQGAARLGLQAGVDLVTPVPLHPSRYAERGFNQSAEIARRAARQLHCRFEEAVVRRLRDTPPQVGLDPERRRLNVHGAFAAGGVGGCHVVLVDDVVTTGRTACAVARALRQAGAASVTVWAVARAEARSRPRAGIR